MSEHSEDRGGNLWIWTLFIWVVLSGISLWNLKIFAAGELLSWSAGLMTLITFSLSMLLKAISDAYSASQSLIPTQSKRLTSELQKHRESIVHKTNAMILLIISEIVIGALLKDQWDAKDRRAISESGIDYWATAYIVSGCLVLAVIVTRIMSVLFDYNNAEKMRGDLTNGPN